MSAGRISHVEVSRRAAERVAAGHPWIYASDVVNRFDAPSGAVVRVLDPRRKLLGVAHHSSTSQIALRLLSRRDEPVNAEFFRRRIGRAAAYRREVVCDTAAYRLVYGEADLLPALIVDRYADCLVLQTLSQGMDAAKSQIVEALAGLFSPAGILERNDAPVRAKEGLPLAASVLAGQVPEEIEFEMNHLRLGARPLTGQKTGVFLDQRENYLAARRFARGPALDCFTYAGGFALHLAGTCPSVEAVDSSTDALEMGRRNAQRNGFQNVEFRQADVFELLTQYASARRKFGTVILDPPAFAKSRGHLPQAVRGYRDINLRALRLLDHDGLLITCSCSHHLSEADFLHLLAEAALDAGRELRILERRTQALDHPILLTVPETHYLKCLILNVV
ncbi:MAG TPA: class I SAM-dependent rRNA methyltransferase [Bryobacterales bacterium]|nr:class I SAM-dependent rRNA methyltransferase [Bryobacterales bacterium]